MILSIVFYIAWVLLIFVHSKRAKSGSFNEDFLCPSATKSLQGLAAAGVFCHHLSQRQTAQALNQIQIFKDIGFLFVALFFFVSGYGLVKSLETKEGYLKTFLKKRLSVVLVPYFIMNIFYIIWHILMKTPMEKSEWVCKILNISLLNDNAWFVPVITIMYLAFYFAFREKSLQSGAADRRELKGFILVFSVIAVQAAWFLFNKHFPWWLGQKDWWKVPGAFQTCAWWKRPVMLWFEGEWWVNSTLTFLFGMIVARRSKKFFAFFTKRYFVKLVLSVLLFAFSTYLMFFCYKHNIHYWLEFGGDNSTKPRLIMFLVQTDMALSFTLLCILLMMKSYANNKVTRFLGNYSLEIYLMQAIPMRTLYLLFNGGKEPMPQADSIIYVILCIVCTLLLALILKFLSKSVLRRFL